MTRREAIALIREHKIVHKMNEPRAIFISEALDMAIQALDQKPCKDAISRQAVRDTIFEECSGIKLDIDFSKVLLLQRAIEDLPSVVSSQEPKTGHWISRNSFILPYKCSECNYASKRYNFCPNCGAKMESKNEE